MKDTFPTAGELQVEFKNKINEIINYIKQFSVYDIFSYFYFEYKSSYGEDVHRDERWLKSKKILHLQILFSCINESDFRSKKIQQKDFDKIEKILDELQICTYRYKLVQRSSKKLTKDEVDYIMHSDSFKDWSGKRYDVFEVQHHKDLLECLKEEFLDTYNFSLNDLYNGILELKNNFYFKFENSANELRSIVKKEKIDINDDGTYNIPERLDDNKKEKIEEYSNNIFSLELANIKENTKWTTFFIEQFVVDKEEYKEFWDNISIENWDRLINKIKYRPLIKIDDNYYILLEQQFYDNFDRIAILGMCQKLKNKREEIRARYTSNVEQVVLNYFKNIFNTKQSYIGNYYEYNQKIIENDILLIYDNNVFIIEVKAGNFTPELASSDLDSHKETLNNLIVKANQQQDSLEKCLIDKKCVTIFDSNNKKTRNKKAEIKINDDTKIFKIIITAEAFNDIEARIDKVKILSLSENTLVFCLDDLRVYSEYFRQHPCYFIQYLLQRKKAIGNKNIDLVDELYHLGMWIEYNFYNEYINKRIKGFEEENDIMGELGIVAISGEDWMEELDTYYNSLWFKKSKVSKPFRKTPKEIKKVIKSCEENIELENHTYLTTFLLNLNFDTQNQIEKIILQSKEFYKNNRRPKYGYMTLTKKDENDIDGVCISSIYDEQDIDKDVLFKDAYANMYLAKNNKVLVVFLYYDKKDEIVKVFLRILSALDYGARTTEILNLAEALRCKRGIKLESKKIGRNELCPCGSGKKYKRCCLLK